MTLLTTDMDDPTIVYGIMAWEMHGPYLFTALLKVTDQLIFLHFPSFIPFYFSNQYYVA